MKQTLQFMTVVALFIVLMITIIAYPSRAQEPKTVGIYYPIIGTNFGMKKTIEGTQLQPASVYSVQYLQPAL